MRTQEQVKHNYKSTRKPYNDKSGYIASMRSGANKGWVVIYLGKNRD